MADPTSVSRNEVYGVLQGNCVLQKNFFEIKILCLSDSVFSPDSEYGVQKS